MLNGATRWSGGVHKLAPALRMSATTATNHVVRAVSIVTRLPATLAALGRGELDLARVLAIEEATCVLDADTAAKVETEILPAGAAQRGAFRHPDGPTTRETLAALCRRHHRAKHIGGWTVRQLPGCDGDLAWTSPTGHLYTTYPRRATGAWQGATTGALCAAASHDGQITQAA